MLLIVDDDPVIRSVMRDALEDDGFTVIEAEDGVEACERCAETVPALIVVDAVMPSMDGFELCRALRKQPQTAQVPILMATGLDDSGSIARAYEAGATDFIAKPLNWLMLTQRVRYMLRAARAFDDLRQNQERLVAAKDAAEAASKAKSEFLANMSHELRTPLNAIIGFASILQQGIRGPIDARYVDDAKIIADSGAHLLAIINDILDIAKAEAQSLDLSEDMVDIAETVAFSADMVADMAKNNEVVCSYAVDDGLPAFWGDAKKLRQVLINLLSNAVKFTPEGGSVTLGANRRAQRRGRGDPHRRYRDRHRPRGHPGRAGAVRPGRQQPRAEIRRRWARLAVVETARRDAWRHVGDRKRARQGNDDHRSPAGRSALPATSRQPEPPAG